jgi:hypothetical protein
MAFQSARRPNFGSSEIFNLGVSGQNDIWIAPMANHREYYKGEGGGFPQVRVVVNLVSSCMPVIRPCTKNAPITH